MYLSAINIDGNCSIQYSDGPDCSHTNVIVLQNIWIPVSCQIFFSITAICNISSTTESSYMYIVLLILILFPEPGNKGQGAGKLCPSFPFVPEKG